MNQFKGTLNFDAKSQFKRGRVMFLSQLVSDSIITIHYYQEGSLTTMSGKVHKIDTIKQTLSLIDRMEDKVKCINFSSIVRISL